MNRSKHRGLDGLLERRLIIEWQICKTFSPFDILPRPNLKLAIYIHRGRRVASFFRVALGSKLSPATFCWIRVINAERTLRRRVQFTLLTGIPQFRSPLRRLRKQLGARPSQSRPNCLTAKQIWQKAGHSYPGNAKLKGHRYVFHFIRQMSLYIETISCFRGVFNCKFN